MQQQPDSEGRGGWLWMVACCTLMVAVIVLVVLGYLNL
jgi:hypothetical protein